MTGYDAAEQYIEKISFGWLTKGLGMLGGLFGKAAPTALSAVTDLTPAAMKALQVYSPRVTAFRKPATTATTSWLNRDNLGKAGLFAGGMATDHLLFNNKQQQQDINKMAAENYIKKIAAPGWRDLATGVFHNVTNPEFKNRIAKSYGELRGNKLISPSVGMKATREAVTHDFNPELKALWDKARKRAGYVGTAGMVIGAEQFGEHQNKKMMEQIPQQTEVQVVYPNGY